MKLCFEFSDDNDRWEITDAYAYGPNGDPVKDFGEENVVEKVPGVLLCYEDVQRDDLASAFSHDRLSLVVVDTKTGIEQHGVGYRDQEIADFVNGLLNL